MLTSIKRRSHHHRTSLWDSSAFFILRGVERPMQTIKNAIGKTVCRADASNRTVEIVHKGIKTTVTFLENGKMKVENTTAA